MSNLDNLVAKIIKDGEERAKTITNEAEDKAKEIVAKKLAEAEKEKAAIAADAKIQAENAKEKIISATKLKVRDDMLIAKQESIANICDEALRRLNDLPSGEFEKFVSDSLSAERLSGHEEVILPDKYRNISVNVKVSDEQRKISGGFILKSNDMEKNNTFESLLHYYRDDVEELVTQNLFQ